MISNRVKSLLSPPVKNTGVPPPKRIISKDNEGDVYLFIHGIDAAHSLSMSDYDIEHAHFSIIIDIAGESHGEIVSGYEIYIGICDSTPVARFFFPKWTRRICRRGLEVRCLGKVPPLIIPEGSTFDDCIFTWKQGMDKHACQVYQRMVSENAAIETPTPPSPSLTPPIISTITSSPSSSASSSASTSPATTNTNTSHHPRAWSSRINSQQFARALAVSLHLVWPVDVPMAQGNHVPAMFDRDMLLYSIPKLVYSHFFDPLKEISRYS